MDNNKYLSDIFEGTLSGQPLDEILHLAKLISPTVDLSLLENVHKDLTAIFTGLHPGFQKNTLPYHNLRHSQMVVLATVRLFHGLHCNNVTISKDTLIKGLLSAYFHDTGMLLLESDPAQSEGEYIPNHEARSVLFLKGYCAGKGISQDIPKDAATIIDYTNLTRDPATFTRHNSDIQIAGQVVGSADILAQMADRYYLECLPLLYNEQKAGGISQHTSALQLMEHTATFYYTVVLKRVMITFSNTSSALQTHFRERYTVNRNLYIENINKNIRYLKQIIAQCDDINCLDSYLKRTPPTI